MQKILFELLTIDSTHELVNRSVWVTSEDIDEISKKHLTSLGLKDIVGFTDTLMSDEELDAFFESSFLEYDLDKMMDSINRLHNFKVAELTHIKEKQLNLNLKERNKNDSL